MEILKSVSFSIPSKTILDETLRKFRLIEEHSENNRSTSEVKQLKAKLISMCI